MAMDINEKRFTSEQVAAVAGCREATLRQWRSRHDLLSDDRARDETPGMEVKYFSLVDVCVVRAVQMLTTSGASTSDAIASTLADADIRAPITILLSEDEPFSTLFGFRSNGRDKPVSAYIFKPEDLPRMLAKAKGTMIILDVLAVIDHVRSALNIKDE